MNFSSRDGRISDEIRNVQVLNATHTILTSGLHTNLIGPFSRNRSPDVTVSNFVWYCQNWQAGHKSNQTTQHRSCDGVGRIMASEFMPRVFEKKPDRARADSQ